MKEGTAAKLIFEELVSQAESLLTADDLVILQTQEKHQAIRLLHLTAGNQLRNSLGLWSPDAADKLMAIEQHAHQGMLIGFDADGASSALLGHLWDRFNVTHGGSAAPGQS